MTMHLQLSASEIAAVVAGPELRPYVAAKIEKLFSSIYVEPVHLLKAWSYHEFYTRFHV